MATQLTAIHPLATTATMMSVGQHLTETTAIRQMPLMSTSVCHYLTVTKVSTVNRPILRNIHTCGICLMRKYQWCPPNRRISGQKMSPILLIRCHVTRAAQVFPRTERRHRPSVLRSSSIQLDIRRLVGSSEQVFPNFGSEIRQIQEDWQHRKNVIRLRLV